MNKSSLYTCLLLLVVFVASCGSDGAPADLGAADFGPGVIGISPDGTGYCCEPLRGGRSCGSPEFLPGGYVTDPRACLRSIHDVIWTPTTREFVDAYGCVALDPSTGMNCNALPDLGPSDAGSASDADVRD
jgi:hypothetical protein